MFTKHQLGIHDFKTLERYHGIKITKKILPAAESFLKQYFSALLHPMNFYCFSLCLKLLLFKIVILSLNIKRAYCNVETFTKNNTVNLIIRYQARIWTNIILILNIGMLIKPLHLRDYNFYEDSEHSLVSIRRVGCK